MPLCWTYKTLYILYNDIKSKPIYYVCIMYFEVYYECLYGAYNWFYVYYAHFRSDAQNVSPLLTHKIVFKIGLCVKYQSLPYVFLGYHGNTLLCGPQIR